MKAPAIRRSIALQALRLTALAALFIHSGGAAVRAATVANYTFSGNSLASSDTDTSSTAGNIVVGAGLSGSTTFFTAFTSAFGMTSDHTPSTSQDAIAADDYFSFTVTPSGGQSLSYSSLQFSFAFSVFQFPYTATVDVRWSVDSFAAVLGTKTISPSSNTSLNGASATFNPSLVQTGPVEFRFYFYDTLDSSLDTIGITSVSLTANVVPEPQSPDLLAAVGSVLIGGFRFRRRG
jgi:hypothetical protein